MITNNTPVEDHLLEFGLLVKREDLSCLPPGPPFSKTRGVFAHLEKRPESVIGVLDTYHSQAGHAVARACQVLGKRCLNFYPVYKKEPGPHAAQIKAVDLGAHLYPLKAGMSAVLFYQARAVLKNNYPDSYLMPNALKLSETISETEAEFIRSIDEVQIQKVNVILIAVSSATIAAGVLKALHSLGIKKRVILHMGYTRSKTTIRSYIESKTFFPQDRITLVDEGYAYKDQAKKGPTPPWPCNPYYDLKAFRWWMAEGKSIHRTALFWNIG